MTRLRQRMLEDMQLRGLSARTQGCYVAAVRQLAEHYRRSPDQITEEDLRQYFLYLANEKQVARATATIALCGIRFFFEHTLQRDWTTLRFVRPAREQKLPVVLSRDEVRRVLAAIRIPVYRACLTTIYGCGLRLLEGAQLQVTIRYRDNRTQAIRRATLSGVEALECLATIRSRPRPRPPGGRAGDRDLGRAACVAHHHVRRAAPRGARLSSVPHRDPDADRGRDGYCGSFLNDCMVRPNTTAGWVEGASGGACTVRREGTVDTRGALAVSDAHTAVRNGQAARTYLAAPHNQ